MTRPNLPAPASWSVLAPLAAAASGEDIRGVRPPLVLPPWWRIPLIVALVALGFALLALAARWVWRRTHRPETALQRAMRALCTAEAHARAGRARPWAEIVADTARAALAARLGLDVLPRTTSEIARTTSATPDAVELLETCDLARFACAALTTDDLLASTGRARALIAALYDPRPSTPAGPAPSAVPA